MLVDKEMQKGGNCKLGDAVKMKLDVDTEPRVVTLAADVRRTFAQNKKAKTAWDSLPYSHQREFIQYVDEAKRPETRARRIEELMKELEARAAERQGRVGRRRGRETGER